MNARRKRRRRTRTPEPVIVQPLSGNAKTGRVTVTYAPQQTCPKDCPLLHCGCYAENGPIGIITRRLASDAGDASLNDIARAEADMIDATPALADMRLHAVGDCSTDAAAKVVSAAAERYEERGARFGVRVWTYTHAWKTVGRESWGGVSVLASCHSVEEAGAAMGRGYAASVIVAEFPDGARAWHEDGVTLVPCPWQTNRVTCRECRLCTSDRKLLDARRAIAFKAHGTGRASVLKSLPMAGG